MPTIEIDGLRKEFGGVTALDGLSFAVEEGEVFGFLGPNGAGKSTTINVLLDFTRPTAGSASVFGMDTRRDSVAIRERTGTLLEGYGVYPELTAREHVEHAIRIKEAADDPDDLLDRTGLEERDRAAAGLSKGMRQRLALAVALVGEPDLLVLDEPSTGLDPNGARRLREIVETEAERGATVFFSSHILEQVETVADTIAILLDGQLAATGGVEALKRQLSIGTTLSIDVTDAPDGLLGRLRDLPGIREASVDAGWIEVVCDDDGGAKLRALNAVADAGVYRDFDLREASLSAVFSEYTTPDERDGTEDPIRERGAPESGDDEAGKYLEWSRGDRR